MEGHRKPTRRFFLYRPVAFSPTGRTSNVQLVELGEGKNFIMRPIMRGICKYESAIDGTLRLVDFAKMNEAMDVFDENERRLNPEPTK